MQDIRFEGTPTLAEARRVRRLGIPRFLLWMWPLYVLSVGYDLWEDGIEGIPEHPWQFLIRVVLLGMWVALLLFPRLSSQFRKVGPRSSVAGLITETAITWKSQEKTSTLPWWAFVCRRGSGDAVVLCVGLNDKIYLTKGMMASANEWQSVKKLLSENVHRGNLFVRLFN
jgi:hypothetical protein